MTDLEMTLRDLDDTDRLGRAIGAALCVGDIVGLVGPLGSGKTTLVKSIAAGAGVADPQKVNSPTFVIVNEYEADRRPGDFTLFHIDTYRLRGSDDLEAIGFDEMCRSGPVLIEWADRVADLLGDDRLLVTIEPTGESSRRVRLTGAGPSWQRLSTAAKEVRMDS